MLSRPVLCIIAAVLLSAGSAAHADGKSPAAEAAPSVADMLQRKHETQMRDRLAKEGRWEEVRRLEEAQAKRQQQRAQQIVAQLNGELSRSSKADSAGVNAVLDACDKQTLRLR